MRTCQSCGKENPLDQDFCSCGEYLRWEPTGYMQAITPEQAAEAKQEAEPPPSIPAVQQAAPVVPETPGNGHGNGHSASPAPPPPPPPPLPVTRQPEPQSESVSRPVAKTMIRGAVPPPPTASSAGRHDEAEPATIVLRRADGESAKGEVLHMAVEPGTEQQIFALIRNQSGIVDNYDLRVEGMPDDWWTISPGTVYLVPFGSGGTYEQEVVVQLHPPRTPTAEARVWELKVVADSKAHRIVAAQAPLALHVEPYIDTATALRPQRRRGRKKATYDVTVTNRANAPVLVALDGEDPDGEMIFGFNRPPQEIPAGGAVTTQMQVRPPKQIWMGRGRDRNLSVLTVTGEEAAARAAAEPLSAAVLENAPPPKKRRFWQRRRAPHVPGVYPPRVYKPQMFPPDVQMGPGGLNVRMPQFRAPQVQGPHLAPVNAGAMMRGKVKMPGMPGRGGATTPMGPMMPSQGMFRQRPWLPWWLIPVILLLALLLLLLFKFILPHNVVVPEVVGKQSAFEAEETLTKSKLVLDPNTKSVVDDKAPAGSVVNQTPDPGKEVTKGSKVTIQIAVGSGQVTVPKIVGLSQTDADKALRGKELTLGQSSPPNAKPEAKIESQIPAEGEVVKKGTPVNFFFPDPKPGGVDGKGGDSKDGAKAGDGKGGAGGDGGAGGGAGGKIIIPAVGKADTKTYAKSLADLGLVPLTKPAFSDKPVGTAFQTEPPGGTEVKAKSKVTVLVSKGQPDVVFSNGKNVLRINGATGAKEDPVADTEAEEKDPTWSADGTHVAYTADGQLMLKNVVKENSGVVPLRPASEKYGDLAWAPTVDRNVIAMRSDPNGTDDNDLCLAEVRSDATAVSCKTEPKFSVIRAIHWAPNGKTLIGTGVKLPRSGTFGIVRWTLKDGKKAFSPNEKDWNKGKFVSDIDTAGKGVLDAAFSPNGKQIALVSNIGSSSHRLWLTDNTGSADDFLLTAGSAKPTRACKVSWRSDSQRVIVVQGDAKCTEEVSALVSVNPSTSRDERDLNASGDDPSFRPPLPSGG